MQKNEHTAARWNVFVRINMNAEWGGNCRNQAVWFCKLCRTWLCMPAFQVALHKCGGSSRFRSPLLFPREVTYSFNWYQTSKQMNWKFEKSLKRNETLRNTCHCVWESLVIYGKSYRVFVVFRYFFTCAFYVFPRWQIIKYIFLPWSRTVSLCDNLIAMFCSV